MANLGDVTQPSGTVGTASNLVVLQKATAGITGNLESLQGWVRAYDETWAQIIFVIYSDNAGVPGTLLGKTAAFNAPPSDVMAFRSALLLSLVSLTASASYWVGMQVKHDSTIIAVQGSMSGYSGWRYYDTVAFDDPPANFAGLGALDTDSFYGFSGTYESTGGGPEEYIYTMTGGISFVGETTHSKEKINLMTSGIQLAGDSSHETGGSHEYVMTGGLAFTGGSTHSMEKAYVGTGGVTVNGSSTHIKEKVAVSTGGITFSGSSAHLKEKINAMTGGIQLAGASSHTGESGMSIPHRLVVFGDSITAGSGATTENDRWATKLAYFKALTLINKGISGTVLQNSIDLNSAVRANNGRDRYVADLLTGLNLSSNYVIAYGLNDLRYSNTAPSQFSLANFINDYREIINGLTAAGVSAVNICLVTPFWIPTAGYTAGGTGFNGSNQTIHETYVAAILALAIEMGCTSCDVYLAMKNHADPASLIGADNIHPNDVGHEFIFQTLSTVPMAEGKQAATDIAFSATSAVLVNLGSNVWWSNDANALYNGIGQVVGTFTVGTEEAWLEAAYDNNTDAGMVLSFGTTSGLNPTSGNNFLMLIGPNGIIFKAFNGASSTTSGYTIPAAGANVRARIKCGIDGVVVCQTSSDSITWTTRYTFGSTPASGTYYARMYTSGTRKTYRPKSFGIPFVPFVDPVVPTEGSTGIVKGIIKSIIKNIVKSPIH